MFERFTAKAIETIKLGQEESRRLGHNFFGTEQILLGLIREGTGIAAQVLRNMGVNLQGTRIEVEKIIGRGSGFVAPEIPFTPKVKRVFELSFEEACQLNHNYICTEHLLLGLIREKEGVAREGVAIRVLENLDIDLSKVRTQILQILNKDYNSSKLEVTITHPLKPEVTITHLVKAGLLDELTKCFDEEHIAKDLLIRISFPRIHQPNFHKFNNPYGFWLKVCEKIESGILDNSQSGFEELVQQAMNIYRGNRKFQEIYEEFFS